jgi:SAM-dependent methyltransferase
VPVHPSARNFDSAEAVSDYERGRPGYSPEVGKWLVEQLRLDQSSTIVDLGAGTGKMTRLLLACGARVIAVEPAGEMRRRLVEEAPEADARGGTAEAIPLEDSSADAVVVAQAFHWFANSSAVAEIHRVLRPDGRLGLVWNCRDAAQPLQRALTEVVEPFRKDTPTHSSGRWRMALDADSLFAPVAEAHIPAVQELDHEAFLARATSISFVAALENRTRKAVEDQLRALVADEPEPIHLHYVTDCFVFARRPVS